MLQPSPHPRRTIPRRSSASQTHAAYPFPSPTRGVDTSQPMPGGNPLTAIRMDNLIPRALGCQLRKGYRRWVSNMGGEIRSLMQYHPAAGEPALFAANDAGDVFDVTTFQASSFVPTAVLSVPGGQPPGEWHSLNYVSDAGIHYLVMVNPGGGYWTWDGTTWVEHTAGVAAGQIDGADPHLFAYVMVYKRRLVFVEMNSTRAWYLPVGQIAGLAEEFDFGPLFPNGGALAAMVNWTFDGAAAGGTGSAGGGLDNKLVVIADQGDVLVYSGNDPTSVADFSLVGRWYVGRVPVGRRFFSQYGSDIAIVTERGLAFMSELMRGEGFFQHASTAQQINSELAVQVTQTLDVRYWEVEFLPHEQLIIIKLPKFNNTDRQWAYEVNNKAFCGLLDMPMATVETFNGRSFSGDQSGNVWWLFEGQSDGAVDTVAGKDLQGMVVTSFQSLGDGVRLKRFLMVKPSFISNSAPGVQAQLNSEWSLALPDAAPAYLGAGADFWDVGTWDQAVWSGAGLSYESWKGASGTGRYGSLSMRVRGAADTIFVGWQAVVEQGGIL